jgi:hypothetical protein
MPNDTVSPSFESEASKFLAQKDGVNQDETITVQKQDVLTGSQVTNASEDSSEIDDSNIKGRKALPVKNLPSTGLFNIPTMGLTISAAEVQEIRQWSTIDESDWIDIDKKINFILERCLYVKDTATGQDLSWKDIRDVDRFYVIFCIHELTFPKGENKLMLKFMCQDESCARSNFGNFNVDKVQLNSRMLDIFTISQQLQSWYSPNKRCFTAVSPAGKSYDIYMPSVGTASKVKDYMNKKKNANEYLDMSFFKVFPYMVDDWRVINDNYIEKCRIKSYEWTKDDILFMNKVIDEIETNSKLNAINKCSKCESDVEISIFFRGGIKIKSLFAISA